MTKQDFKNAEAFLLLLELSVPYSNDEKLFIFSSSWIEISIELILCRKKTENISLGNDVKCILFFHNISSTVLKSLYSGKTKVILLTSKKHVY